MTQARIRGRAVVAILLGLTLQACSLVAVDRLERYRDSEGVFAAEMLETIEPHITTRLWLLQQFGPPLYTTHGPDDAEVLTWQFVRQNLNRTALFGLFRYTRTTEDTRYLHAVIHEGLVVRHWRDQSAHVDVDRVFPAVGIPRHTAPVEESVPLPVPQRRHWTEPAVNAVAPVTPLVVEDTDDSENTATGNPPE